MADPTPDPPAVPLTDAEALERRKRGEGNDVVLVTSRTLGGILRANLFTTLNMIIISIGVILVVLGRVGDGVFSAGLVFFNVAINVCTTLCSKPISPRPRSTNFGAWPALATRSTSALWPGLPLRSATPRPRLSSLFFYC